MFPTIMSLDRMQIVGAIAAVALLCPGAFSRDGQPARSDDSAARLQIFDASGRDVSALGIELIDWEGYIANPAIKLSFLPPADAALPAKAVLTAREPRLHFDLPSEIGPNGPRKEIVWQTRERMTLFISIFPDRDGKEEEHSLDIHFTDAHGKMERQSMKVRVVDQDRARGDEFQVTVDFSQDKTGFFDDANKRATIIQAANDWAYFLSGMQLKPVAAGAEKTPIWGPDGFQRTTEVTNAGDYRGYLLYAYGIRNPLLDSHSAIPAGWLLLDRDPAARMIRSGGEPSAVGGFQVSGDTIKPLRRSGGVEIEVQGNYNTKGWLVTLADGEWWKATNLGDTATDLYSIAHHEIGHALIFNPNNSLVKRGEKIDDERIRAYLASSPTVSKTDHLEGVIDPASLHGAFGNEYHGRMPRGRWLITKLDLLCARAIGYELRETSAVRR